MVVDSRFAVATHIMCVLAFVKDQYVNATFIGEQISINPVVVRRTLALLARANLVKSLEGSKGGYKLIRDPNQVSLLDVYLAIHPKKKFTKSQGFPESNCEEGKRADSALKDVFSDVQQAVDGILSSRTLIDVLEGEKTSRKKQ